MEVVAPKPGPVPEPISPRLVKTLVHQHRQAHVVWPKWSPDGRQIVAGDYPGGMIELWDVASGRELAKFETNYGYRSSADYFQITPDWKSIFVAREKRKRIHDEKDGKGIFRFEFESDIRAWDLATGQLREIYAPGERRGTSWIQLSPDGSKLLALESIPDEKGYSQVVVLWDVQSKQRRQLPGVQYGSRFMPDGRMVYARVEEGQYTKAVKLFDTTTGQEQISIPVSQPLTWASIVTVAPDRATIVGHHQTFSDSKTWDKSKSTWKFWDARTGNEVASLEIDGFFTQVSPSGQIVATTSRATDPAKLYLIDVLQHKVIRIVDLGANVRMHFPAFSKDGRWIAVWTQAVPKDPQAKTASAERPQPRVQIIDVETGAIREVLVLPLDSGSPAFSPDGKFMATGGRGEVHIWDVSDLSQ